MSTRWIVSDPCCDGGDYGGGCAAGIIRRRISEVRIRTLVLSPLRFPSHNIYSRRNENRYHSFTLSTLLVASYRRLISVVRNIQAQLPRSFENVTSDRIFHSLLKFSAILFYFHYKTFFYMSKFLNIYVFHLAVHILIFEYYLFTVFKVRDWFPCIRLEMSNLKPRSFLNYHSAYRRAFLARKYCRRCSILFYVN